MTSLKPKAKAQRKMQPYRKKRSPSTERYEAVFGLENEMARRSRNLVQWKQKKLVQRKQKIEEMIAEMIKVQVQRSGKIRAQREELAEIELEIEETQMAVHPDAWWRMLWKEKREEEEGAEEEERRMLKKEKQEEEEEQLERLEQLEQFWKENPAEAEEEEEEEEEVQETLCKKLCKRSCVKEEGDSEEEDSGRKRFREYARSRKESQWEEEEKKEEEVMQEQGKLFLHSRSDVEKRFLAKDEVWNWNDQDEWNASVEYSRKWYQQCGIAESIPKRYTPCLYHFKARHGCQKDNCLFSHNEKIFGEEPLASMLQSLSWPKKTPQPPAQPPPQRSSSQYHEEDAPRTPKPDKKWWFRQTIPSQYSKK